MARVESLLAARLFIAPQTVDDHIFFLSNLSGKLSLYSMAIGGSVPQLLLPPDIALPNPELVGGASFCVYPSLGKILVMIDHNGDETYRPYWIPLEGDFPQPLFADTFADSLVYAQYVDLRTSEITQIAQSPYGFFAIGASRDISQVVLVESYSAGDSVMYVWSQADGLRKLYGTPIADRAEGEMVAPSGFANAVMVGDEGILTVCSLFEDSYGLAYIRLNTPDQAVPVRVKGTTHDGMGEMVSISATTGDRCALAYNIDGCSWLYEGTFYKESLQFVANRMIAGSGAVANGVMHGHHYEGAAERHTFAYCTATSPTQLYVTDGDSVRQITQERVLGLRQDQLSRGEDASFISHDGLRISARLYLPADSDTFSGKCPLVYYVHGGPQSQERPDFAWFSMPLIQLLTLNGFAVFVPNARGSTGYGMRYMKHVDRDWGGQDRLDHVHAMGLLANESRVDTARAGVVGRSYGGFMTLTLAARHPALWKAAIDMFGPYNLITFAERFPKTWAPYFDLALGNPIRDRDALLAMSPSTYIDQLTAPLLVIQGKNDPRVAEAESRDVVANLQAQGKNVDLLVFDNEGHDILRYENRVTVYNRIVGFFAEHL
jgi:pimeloyl-ACP methyl ester carboxylesterase